MKRSLHSLNHYRLATADMGELIPIGCVETLPGDVFRHNTTLFIRLSPMAAPVMHPVTARVHHFWQPHRLGWEEAGGTGTWEDFITGGNSGNDAQTVPTINTTGTVGDLLDYLGIADTAGVPVNALALHAVNNIFNNWYADQDLVTQRAWNDLTVPRIAWGKDYLTSARPFPQRGDAVALPLGDTAPVVVQGHAGSASIDTVSVDGTSKQVFVSPNTVAGNEMVADLANAIAPNVADWRLAVALQTFKEIRARFGARYPEFLAHYGVNGYDGRLQIPEYLGGGSAQIQMSEVMSTSPAAGGRAFGVGDLYGHGVSAMRSNSYRRRFEEHGYVISFASIRPVAMYMDGIPRTFLRQDREDFYEPTLETVGEQAVWKNEVFADAVDGDDVWAYQGRYDDYRHQLSGVSGEFRSVLDYWHLGRTFAADPALNETFVTCSPSKRIFNEQTQHSLWIQARHNISAIRPVSRRATTRTL